MTERKPLSVSVDMDTDKLQLKLRAIAKHAEALANELDVIDNAWQCECGSDEYEDTVFMCEDAASYSTRQCLRCGESYGIPTGPQGND